MEGNHIPPIFDSEPPPFDDDDFGDFVSDDTFGSGVVDTGESIQANGDDYFGGGKYIPNDTSWNAFGSAYNADECNGFASFDKPAQSNGSNTEKNNIENNCPSFEKIETVEGLDLRKDIPRAIPISADKGSIDEPSERLSHHQTNIEDDSFDINDTLQSPNLEYNITHSSQTIDSQVAVGDNTLLQSTDDQLVKNGLYNKKIESKTISEIPANVVLSDSNAIEGNLKNSTIDGNVNDFGDFPANTSNYDNVNTSEGDIVSRKEDFNSAVGQENEEILNIVNKNDDVLSNDSIPIDNVSWSDSNDSRSDNVIEKAAENYDCNLTKDSAESSNSIQPCSSEVTDENNTKLDDSWGDFDDNRFAKEEGSENVDNCFETATEFKSDIQMKDVEVNEWGDFGNMPSNKTIDDTSPVNIDFKSITGKSMDNDIESVTPEATDRKSSIKPKNGFESEMESPANDEDQWGDFGNMESNNPSDDNYDLQTINNDFDYSSGTKVIDSMTENIISKADISNSPTVGFSQFDDDLDDFESASEMKAPLEDKENWSDFGNIQTNDNNSDWPPSNDFKISSNNKVNDTAAISTHKPNDSDDDNEDDDWGNFDTPAFPNQSTTANDSNTNAGTHPQSTNSSKLFSRKADTETKTHQIDDASFACFRQSQKLPSNMLSVHGMLEAIHASFLTNDESLEVNTHMISMPLRGYVAVINESSVQCFASFLKEAEDDDSSEMVRFDRSSMCGSMMESFGMDANALDNHSSSPALSPSLSASIESWDKIETEPSILMPDKPTLLHQSQGKEDMGQLLSKEGLKRNPSLSNLKRDGESGSASETTSLDLDFFTGGVASQNNESSTIAATDSDLFGIDLNDVTSIPTIVSQKNAPSEIDNIVRDSKTSVISQQGVTNPELSGAASAFLNSIEDISFMNANVLMFPATLLPTEGDL